MKLLIVDDERHVREAIKLLIQWDRYSFSHIFEAADGQSAIEIIEAERPDVILTDMLMPHVGGVQLLEWIQRHSPACKTIVISGYDDFNYVRHTIKYGGQDYILKPIDENQLNEALDKAIQSIQKELELYNKDQEHFIKLNTVKPLYWNKVLSSLLEHSAVTPALLKEMMTEFNIEEPIQHIRIAVLPIHHIFYRTIYRFNQNIELLSYSLTNICNEFLQKQRIGYAFHNWNSGFDIVLIVWKDYDKLYQNLEAINRGIEATFGHKCDFGLSTVEAFPNGIKQAFKNAVTAIKKINLLKVDSRIHSYSHEQAYYELSLKFDKYQEHIRLALLSEQPNQVEYHINQWFIELKKLTYITIEQLEHWQQELLLFEARCFENKESLLISNEFSINGTHFYVPFNSSGAIDFDKWKSLLLKLMKRYSTCIEQSAKQVSISSEIADYINKNYHQELSLQTIADCFLLSREYISRKFKQDMNENLSDYIAKTRINHAKQLLANPQLKLVQISEMVGYTDDKYFSKVFKKLEGISPNQFRKENFIEEATQ